MASRDPGAAEVRTSTASARYILRLPVDKIQSVIQPQNGRRPSTIGAYLSLVQDKGRLIPLIWFLYVLQFAPVWVLPKVTAIVVDLLNKYQGGRQALDAFKWILPAVIGMLIVNIFASTAKTRILSVQRRSLTASLRHSLMQRLHMLNFAFHDQARAGELQNKFLRDVERLENLQHFLTEFLLINATSIVVMLVVIAQQDLVLLAIVALVAPMNGVLVAMCWKRMKTGSQESRIAESGFAAFLHEALNGLRLTRMHAAEDHTEDRLAAMAGKAAAAGIKADTATAYFAAISWTMSQVLNVVILGIGVWRCVHGQVTVGDLLVLVSYYGMTYSGIATIVNGMPMVINAHDAMQSLSELYRHENEERNAGKPQLQTVRGEVSLRDVTFRYEGSDNHSLRELTLDIPAGRSLALVGHSGSGKSTVASLILGLYQPERGSVLIDGHDLAEIDRRSLRKHVGVVSQDTVLFHDTVLGNITWGSKAPDEERARAAARRANADEFIARLTSGYQTMLGDKGIGLSGGQRQRLAIARALYRDPKLLILDEATSALDPESEHLVQQALEELMKGRTTIIIAHRLSTVRGADRIAVLSQGQLSEIGGYDELMEKKGVFYRLARSQLA